MTWQSKYCGLSFTDSFLCHLTFRPTLTAMEATTASDDEARAFLARWLELSRDNNDFDAVMTMYADTVDFYKLGRVKRCG